MSRYKEYAGSDGERTASPPGRGIVLYDYLLCRGGAESVALSLVRGLQGSELCVGFRDTQVFATAELSDLICHELSGPPVFNIRGWRRIVGMNIFQKRGGLIVNYDWAVFSGDSAPVAVSYRPQGGNLYYCHTVPRLAYDLYDWYMEQLPRWQRPALRMMARYIRTRYEEAVARMDRVVANSANVQSRLRRYLDVESEVVHPPCDTEGFRWVSQGGYYLSTARLERYKRLDLIIEAFRRMPERELVVASGGSDEARLRYLASDAPNIRFIGWQTDAGLRELVGSALATIYVPRDEDFGISPIESMAAGKPVIGVAEGGVLETVIEGDTGILVPAAPRVDDLIQAVQELTPERALSMRPACERRAGLFSETRFLCRMKGIIHEITGTSSK